MNCVTFHVSIINFVTFCFCAEQLRDNKRINWKIKFFHENLNYLRSKKKCIEYGGRLAILDNFYHSKKSLQISGELPN